MTSTAAQEVTARAARARSARGGDGGSAVVEFVTLGTLLMIPLIYVVLAMGRVQAASLAAAGSAREAARAFVTSDSEAEAEARALAAVRLGLLDQGFDVEPSSVLTLDCAATPCLTPGARVVTRVTVSVVLPGIPGVVDRAVPTRVTVRAEQVATVDTFRVTGP